LDAVVPAIRRLLRPHGRLFVYDFGWDCYDERAAQWLADHDGSDADNSIAGWWREHGDFHTIPTITKALSARFEPTLQLPRPYLARMLARPDLEAAEHALINATAPASWALVRRRACQMTGRPSANGDGDDLV
ncbi:MAG: hypothetical protein M3070_06065, partial [Actinomycetota bacterium]|nr:hypothetical protein [Actinomycetota bacterium]